MRPNLMTITFYFCMKKLRGPVFTLGGGTLVYLLKWTVAYATLYGTGQGMGYRPD
jgi:hypothetical protein